MSKRNPEIRKLIKKGYRPSDVWNIDMWFIKTIRPMLMDLREKHMGYPAIFKDDESWNLILDRMIFLLNEMDEETCSKQNQYDFEKEWDLYSSTEKEIFNYRDDCKNRFFELFSLYFWNLWD